MKLYVVTSGSYSDYGIERIFESKEKAELYVEILNRGSYMRAGVGEWETSDNKLEMDTKFIWLAMRHNRKGEIWGYKENFKEENSFDNGVLLIHFKVKWEEIKNFSGVKIDKYAKENYLKIMQDKYAEVKSLVELEGYTEKQIDEMLNK